MHIPPPGPQRMRCNSLIFGWALILVGLLLFPIGGFLLMAGGVALLAYAHKLKRLHGGTGVTPAPSSLAPRPRSAPGTGPAPRRPVSASAPKGRLSRARRRRLPSGRRGGSPRSSDWAARQKRFRRTPIGCDALSSGLELSRSAQPASRMWIPGTRMSGASTGQASPAPST